MKQKKTYETELLIERDRGGPKALPQSPKDIV